VVRAKPKLAVALDFFSLKEALSVADQAVPYCDWIEVGTPLILAEGVRAVRAVKARYPLNKTVMADLKLADAGSALTDYFFRAGWADAVTCLGLVDETILGVCQAAKGGSKEVLVDLIGLDKHEAVKRAKQVDKIFEYAGVQGWLLVHTGWDLQAKGKSPFELLRDIHALELPHTRLGVVGGLDAQTLKALKDYPKVELVIVGSAITRAHSPKEAAKEIRGVIDAL